MSLLIYFILAFIPIVAYITVIYFTVPYKSIDIRSSGTYFIIGITSVGILKFIHSLFPGIFQITSPGTLPFTFLGTLYDVFFIYAFVQVALFEEVSKYLSFCITDFIRKNDGEYSPDNPIGIMFYCGISAFGFSFIENIDYATQYGGGIILARSVITTVMHFLCGLIMGYWISAGRLSGKIKNRSILEVYLSKRSRLKRVLYTAVGILCAVFIHGLFDFGCFIQASVMFQFIIILGSMTVSYLAFRRLLELMKK